MHTCNLSTRKVKWSWIQGQGWARWLSKCLPSNLSLIPTTHGRRREPIPGSCPLACMYVGCVCVCAHVHVSIWTCKPFQKKFKFISYVWSWSWQRLYSFGGIFILVFYENKPAGHFLTVMVSTYTMKSWDNDVTWIPTTLTKAFRHYCPAHRPVTLTHSSCCFLFASRAGGPVSNG